MSAPLCGHSWQAPSSWQSQTGFAEQLLFYCPGTSFALRIKAILFDSCRRCSTVVSREPDPRKWRSWESWVESRCDSAASWNDLNTPTPPDVRIRSGSGGVALGASERSLIDVHLCEPRLATALECPVWDVEYYFASRRLSSRLQRLRPERRRQVEASSQVEEGDPDHAWPR